MEAATLPVAPLSEVAPVRATARGRPAATAVSMGAPSAGAGVAEPSATARGTAGVAPCNMRSVAAARRKVSVAPRAAGEVSAVGCGSVVGLSPSAQGSNVSTLSGPGAGPAAASVEPGNVCLRAEDFAGAQGRHAAGAAQFGVEGRAQADDGIAFAAAVDAREDADIALEVAARRLLVDAIDKIGLVADGEASLLQQARRGPMFGARRGSTGACAARTASGASDAPMEASCPASAVKETTSPMPRHQGATTPTAQDIREDEMRENDPYATLTPAGLPPPRGPNATVQREVLIAKGYRALSLKECYRAPAWGVFE